LDDVVIVTFYSGAKASHIVCGGLAQLVRGVNTNHLVGNQVYGQA